MFSELIENKKLCSVPDHKTKQCTFELVVLDETTRKRNVERHLNELERDNYAEVPGLEITGTLSKPRRTSEVDLNQNGQKKKARTKKELIKQLCVKKNLNLLLEESRIELLPPDTPTYLTSAAAPSRYPPRKFCSIVRLELYVIQNDYFTLLSAEAYFNLGSFNDNLLPKTENANQSYDLIVSTHLG
ncbi:262_t:CDS:2 [Ambispora leptoticha]|uniref:262_t:CDS:1 n=1 Tax=Ambispora leptoticha TaxID=144679 RepID=A0A9N8W1A0_9GLOM|nr:262_t:CDS:2 [Ambispora leptoticha]